MKTKRSKPADGGKTMTAAKAAEPKPLTQTQQLVADEVSELLMSGGRAEDLSALLTVALNSAVWRFVDGFDHLNEEQKRASLAIGVERDLAKYQASIVGEWQRNQQASSTEQPDQKAPIIDRIQARVVEKLRKRLEAFVQESSPREQLFMIDVIEDWQNYTLGRADLRPFNILAEAFSRQIHEEAGYVEVPEQHREAVQIYLAYLQKVERAA